ncbi:thiol:disulfide interchange protein DsbA/DsbL [Aliikangiella sp. IMCC44653]
MKYLSLIIAASLLLSACQQDDKAEEKPAAEQSAKVVTEKVEPKPAVPAEPKPDHDHSAADHNHAASNEDLEPYTQVEIEKACETPVVYEFFAYHCPHCYNLEPFAEEWRTKNEGKVKFVTVPTDLGHKQFASYLLVHHAADKLGILDKVRPALFERFHKEKKLFASAEEAAQFLADQGADKAKATETLAQENLEPIGEAIKQDYLMMADYKITHVPQLLVNNKYLTDITRSGGQAETFENIDKLLAMPHNCK